MSGLENGGVGLDWPAGRGGPVWETGASQTIAESDRWTDGTGRTQDMDPLPGGCDSHPSLPTPPTISTFAKPKFHNQNPPASHILENQLSAKEANLRASEGIRRPLLTRTGVRPRPSCATRPRTARPRHQEEGASPVGEGRDPRSRVAPGAGCGGGGSPGRAGPGRAGVGAGAKTR